MSLGKIGAPQRRTIALLTLGAVFLGLGVLLLVMGWPPWGEIRTELGSRANKNQYPRTSPWSSP